MSRYIKAGNNAGTCLDSTVNIDNLQWMVGSGGVLNLNVVDENGDSVPVTVNGTDIIIGGITGLYVFSPLVFSNEVFI